MKRTIILLLCVLMSASCKEMKVGLDDETIGAIDGLTGGGKDSEPSSTESDDQNTDSDSNDSANDYDTEQDSDSSDSLPSGMVYGEQTPGDRNFMATFKIYDYGTTCYSDFPVTIRLYHVETASAQYVDFETTQGDLAWSARIFEDDTFDFTAQFNYPGQFGDDQISEVPCTCAYYTGDYYADEVDCTCVENSYDSDGCELTYKEF
jgi:hypothetical protein